MSKLLAVLMASSKRLRLKNCQNQAGAVPLQSERFYAALKGHGATTRLVLLPHESHGYAARESILHVLAEMDAWLRQYCNKTAEPQSKL